MTSIYFFLWICLLGHCILSLFSIVRFICTEGRLKFNSILPKCLSPFLLYANNNKENKYRIKHLVWWLLTPNEYCIFSKEIRISVRTYWSSTAIIQERCEQYWTSPGSNTPHGFNSTATYHLSRKLYKLDEPDMLDTAGEAKTRS